MNVLEGTFGDPGGRFGIVAGRFNELVVDPLVRGCTDALHRNGVSTDRIDLAWVPGAMEVPLVCQRMAETGHYAAVIALGAVIRGATPHFDVVVSAVNSGCARVALETKIPVVFGVLTTDTIEQAIERSGTKAGNNGFKAAMTAIEMASLLGRLES